MFLISYYVPPEYLEVTKDALFAAGAGKIGAYDQCSWQTLGTGQFRPLAGHKAFIGATGKLEQLSEFKVEVICTRQHLEAAIAALKKAHPYETPAYFISEWGG